MNLKGFLELVGGLSGEYSGYEEKVLKMFSVVLLGDKVEKVSRLEQISHVAENAAKVVERLASLIEEYQEIHPGSNNEKPKKSFVYVRDDDYGTEKKGSVQDHAYVGDTSIFKPARDKSGVDTFHVKQKHK